MLNEFIEASINFTNADVWQLYGVITVCSVVVVAVMFKSSLKDD